MNQREQKAVASIVGMCSASLIAIALYAFVGLMQAQDASDSAALRHYTVTRAAQ